MIKIEVRSVQREGGVRRYVTRAQAIQMIESGEARVRDSRTVQLLDLDRITRWSLPAPGPTDMRAAAGESDEWQRKEAARRIAAWAPA